MTMTRETLLLVMRRLTVRADTVMGESRFTNDRAHDIACMCRAKIDYLCRTYGYVLWQ